MKFYNADWILTQYKKVLICNPCSINSTFLHQSAILYYYNYSQRQ